MRFIKKELDMRRFKHNEVNFEVTFEVQPHYSKIYFMSILRGIDDYHMHSSTQIKFKCTEWEKHVKTAAVEFLTKRVVLVHLNQTSNLYTTVRIPHSRYMH